MFYEAGKQNTMRTLELAFNAAKQQEISHLVIASTVGDTARAALKMVDHSNMKLVVITHAANFRAGTAQEFNADLREEIENAGHYVHSGVHVLCGLGRAIKSKMGWSEEELVASTLRILGQGMKVCIEIAAIATDAGMVPHPGKVISVAGTGYGADTACVISTAPSSRFFDLKVHDVITKPYVF
ncbi:MAG: hypothetical protein A2X77_05175 [Gammaproteobacteria bacterium GWE2_42_36]|nr:MAG: hypothetical protein A2X77_05175 [Gammaproteobacteria bacterium GWE2_42_36]HCU05658.1 hypothetical protein [Coxiellaceae bacterium]